MQRFMALMKCLFNIFLNLIAKVYLSVLSGALVTVYFVQISTELKAKQEFIFKYLKPSNII